MSEENLDLVVNEVLKDSITKINSSLLPPGFRGDARSMRVTQIWLSKLIDAIGARSAKAQGLNKVITTADKLRNNPDLMLYLIKDPNAKGGNGEVVGMLKVGSKHLFLWDPQGCMREVEPLCVLDFYVLESYQRRGIGRHIFDHMLQDMNATPTELAIDGPSEKMERFLAKSYGIPYLSRQNNNFAVAPTFFHNTNINRPQKETAATPLVGRFAAPQPRSQLASVLHGGGGGGSTSMFTDTCSYPVESPNTMPETQADMPRSNTANGSAVHTPATPITATIPDTHKSVAELPPESEKAETVQRNSQVTDRGYFDIKFYHNRLW